MLPSELFKQWKADMTAEMNAEDAVIRAQRIRIASGSEYAKAVLKVQLGVEPGDVVEIHGKSYLYMDAFLNTVSYQLPEESGSLSVTTHPLLKSGSPAKAWSTFGYIVGKGWW